MHFRNKILHIFTVSLKTEIHFFTFIKIIIYRNFILSEVTCNEEGTTQKEHVEKECKNSKGAVKLYLLHKICHRTIKLMGSVVLRTRHSHGQDGQNPIMSLYSSMSRILMLYPYLKNYWQQTLKYLNCLLFY